jgi:hypothetical protein
MYIWFSNHCFHGCILVFRLLRYLLSLVQLIAYQNKDWHLKFSIINLAIFGHIDEAIHDQNLQGYWKWQISYTLTMYMTHLSFIYTKFDTSKCMWFSSNIWPTQISFLILSKILSIMSFIVLYL